MPENMVPANQTPEQVVAHVIAQQSAHIAAQMEATLPKKEAPAPVIETPEPAAPAQEPKEEEVHG